ncbi:MAG: T9SS type A sorting domain-containing protein, partial [Melioribacteraceae bacterium]|nr:T9SS type A sorting domain-containing protein [Melioribacteraceae bacterium]
IDHVTLHDYRDQMLYIRDVTNSWTIQNVIASAQWNKAKESIRLDGAGNTLSYTALWDVSDLFAGDSVIVDSTSLFFVDPMFADTTNGNFALVEGSELIGAASDGANIGDTRWGTTTAVGVEDGELPTEFKLSQNYPNPFNPTTTIQFALNKTGFVEVKIYNIIGQLVTTLANREFDAGIHKLQFDAGRLSSGIYIYNVQFDNKSETRKMLLLK